MKKIVVAALLVVAPVTAALGQNWLTTVVEQEAEVSTARVTGPMIGFIPPAAVPVPCASM